MNVSVALTMPAPAFHRPTTSLARSWREFLRVILVTLGLMLIAAGVR
jgi:hypothetical protein